MAKAKSRQEKTVEQLISSGRKRTNILRDAEQKLIAFLVPKIPSRVTSDMLTGLGFVGNLTVFLSFVLADRIHVNFLLLGVLGFAVNWFGDSLDGRLAYYRNTPHKWYGFALDLTVDWLGTIFIGLGFILYADHFSKYIGYIFVVLYGWEMIIALIRYRVSNRYSIDSGIFGPTEVRIIICLMLILEIVAEGSIAWSAGLICLVLLIANLTDTRKLLKIADDRDRIEREKGNSGAA